MPCPYRRRGHNDSGPGHGCAYRDGPATPLTGGHGVLC